MNPEVGRRLWTELHHYAWHYPREASAEHQRDARRWLARFAEKVHAAGAGHCRCHDEWAHITQVCPPPLDGALPFYWWTVLVHDRINQRLHKPLAHPTWSLHHPLLQPS